MKSIFNFINTKIIGPIEWGRLKYLFTGRAYDLSPEDREHARHLMETQNLLWVSRRDSHLSSYFISFADYILVFLVWAKSGFKGTRPYFGFYSHVFINKNAEKLIEAVGKGVVENYFDDVFNCDSIAALRPAHISVSEWALISKEVVIEAEKQLGKPYDANFDINDESKLSCIELIRLSLKKRVPYYELRFANFESLLKTYKNVTPNMLYKSSDFVIIWEVRK